MTITSINLTKLCFCRVYIRSSLVVFVDKELKILLFANNWDVFAILANEIVGNIIEINTKYIYIF